MCTVALVTARLGSTRLPQKHLLPVLGKPILQFLIDAINREFATEIADGSLLVSIATSEKPENKAFPEKIHDCHVFFGSDGNIPLRHLQAAKAFKADSILSIDGDDILCSPHALRLVYQELCQGSIYVKTQGLPLGMNASGYKTSFLERKLLEIDKDTLLETGWGRLFTEVEPQIINIRSLTSDDLRFTLDYKEDYLFFSALLAEEDIRSGRMSDEDISKFVLQKGLDKIVKPVVREYWINFYANIDKEEQRRIE